MINVNSMSTYRVYIILNIYGPLFNKIRNIPVNLALNIGEPSPNRCRKPGAILSNPMSTIDIEKTLPKTSINHS
jgi:hypothetical protein